MPFPIVGNSGTIRRDSFGHDPCLDERDHGAPQKKKVAKGVTCRLKSGRRVVVRREPCLHGGCTSTSGQRGRHPKCSLGFGRLDHPIHLGQPSPIRDRVTSTTKPLPRRFPWKNFRKSLGAGRWFPTSCPRRFPTRRFGGPAR